MAKMLFRVKLGELAEVPGMPYAYWAPERLRRLFVEFPPLDRDVARMPDKPKIADVKQGLATGDDAQFARYWWEVDVEQIATSREETLGKEVGVLCQGRRSFLPRYRSRRRLGARRRADKKLSRPGVRQAQVLPPEPGVLLPPRHRVGQEDGMGSRGEYDAP